MANLPSSTIKQLHKLLGTATFSAQAFSNLTEPLCQPEQREQLLWEVFTYRGKISEAAKRGILEIVSQGDTDWPLDSFVMTVRRCQAFLKDRWAESLQRLPLEGKAKHHQTGWKAIKNHENLLWAKVQEKCMYTDVTTEADQLLDSLIMFEKSFLIDRMQFSSVYNLLVSLYFKRYRKIAHHSQRTGQQVFEGGINPESINLCSAIQKYLAYYDGAVTIFSYDENFGPSEDGSIIDYYDKALLDRWHEDGARPLLIEDLYRSVSNNSLQAAQKLIADTCCEIIIYSEKKIDTLALAERLITLSSECEDFDDEGIRRFTIDDFRKFFDGDASNSNLSDYVLNKLTFTSPPKPSKPKPFDRFGWRCDVDKMPFIRIGDVILCCKFLMATNAWVFSTVQLALESYQCQRKGKCRGKCSEKCLESVHRKASALELEKVLGRLFEQKGYKVEYPPACAFGSKGGDVDLIVSDGK